MNSLELENLLDARYLFKESALVNGPTHPTTLAAGTIFDYRLTKWLDKQYKPRSTMTAGEINETIIEALHEVVVEQQHEGEDDE